MSIKIKSIVLLIAFFMSISFANNVELLKGMKLSEGKISYNGIPASKIQLYYGAGATTIKKPSKIEVVDDVLVIQTSKTIYHIQIDNINFISTGFDMITIFF